MGIVAEFEFDDLSSITAEQFESFNVKAGTRKKILMHFKVRCDSIRGVFLGDLNIYISDFN